MAEPLSPAAQAVAVSERLPGAKDCALWPGDPEVTPWCWAGKDIDGGWEWAQISMLGLGADTLSRIIAGGGWTHWLPANALPIPEAQPAPTSPSLPKTMQHDLPENIFSIDFPPTKAQANNKGKVLWYAKGHGWYSGWFQSAYMKDTSHWTYAPDDLCIEPDTVDTIRKAFDVWVKTFPEDSFDVASTALLKLGYVAGWKRGES
jgi:hypothetical protein